LVLFFCKRDKMESAALEVACVFAALEVGFALILAIVTFRLKPGKARSLLSFDFCVIFLCVVIALAGSVYGFEEQDELPFVIFVSSQALSDFSALVLGWRANRNNLKRGQASSWRAVISCANCIVSIVFITSSNICRSFLISSLVLRFAWIVKPFLKDLCCKAGSNEDKRLVSLDEWGLLTNNPSIPSQTQTLSRLYVSYEEEEEVDPESLANESDGLSESLLTMGLSFVGDYRNGPAVHQSHSGGCNESDSITDSTDSFPLTRPGSASLVSWTNGNIPPADHAGGPMQAERPAEDALPSSVQVVSWKEVLTTGGVPLVVYILRSDKNGISVHRYGEFRALCNRIISKYFHECGVEAPAFPGRRVFRKLLPQAMGGVVQGVAADREFIASRATGLGDWTQKVLDFIRAHPSDVTTAAMLDFLNPIVKFTPDSDIDQVVRTAVMIFTDTILNPVVVGPLSPFF